MARGLIIAAPRSGSGKTLVTLGLIGALRALGHRLAAAKAGPDYLDTAILCRVAGADAVNLDPWAMSPERLRGLAAAASANTDLLVVEGVMGLFDGAADGTGSTADLAAALNLPVVLVVDAERQAQSIAALVSGFANWRQDVRVAGLVLNRVASTRHEAMLRRALSQLDIELLGVLPRRQSLVLPERHLGLVLPGEVGGFDAVVAEAAQTMAEHIDLDRLLAMTTALPHPEPVEAGERPPILAPLGQRIAIARDDAFAFLYRHWLDDWRAAGAEISFFSPLADEAPAEQADAIFLPGGYPELHAQRLSEASHFIAGLHRAKNRSALIYGECGGFMVLGESLTIADGSVHTMSGLLPIATRIDRPKRVLGYRKLTQSGALPWPKALAGHEFHYSSVRPSGAAPLFLATDALDEALQPMGAVLGRVMGSYAHVIDVGI